MAAKVKVNNVKSHIQKPKVKRPGVHAKTKTSRSKNATNYVKPYISQGK
jgi:ribosomal protein L23